MPDHWVEMVLVVAPLVGGTIVGVVWLSNVLARRGWFDE